MEEWDDLISEYDKLYGDKKPIQSSPIPNKTMEIVEVVKTDTKEEKTTEPIVALDNLELPDFDPKKYTTREQKFTALEKLARFYYGKNASLMELDSDKFRPYRVVSERYRLTIHIDSITTAVTTNEKVKHTLRGVYYNLMFDSEFRIMYSSLQRSKRTPKEINRGYQFSHAETIGSNTSGNHSGLCYGSSNTPMNLGYSAARANSGLALKDIEKILISLPQYLSWESTEGGPYTRISELNNSNVSNHNYRSIPTSSANSLLNTFLLDSEYSLVLNSKREGVDEKFTVSLKDLEADLLKFLNKSCPDAFNNGLLCVRAPNGYYVEKGRISGINTTGLIAQLKAENVQRHRRILFNYEEVPFEVIESDEDPTKGLPECVNPSLMNNFIQKLDSYINQYYKEVYEFIRF